MKMLLYQNTSTDSYKHSMLLSDTDKLMYSCQHKGLRRGALGIFYLTTLSFSDFCEPSRKDQIILATGRGNFGRFLRV